MPAPSAHSRPRDADALRAELRRVHSDSGVQVVFGGEVHDGELLLLSEFFGTWTTGLHGLVIPPRSGLGGRVVAQRRAASVADYSNSAFITHHYDEPVLNESIRSVVAVPVVVGGRSRAVLYAAARGYGPVGDDTADILVQASRRLGAELAIRDEVDRRLRLEQAFAATAGAADAVTMEGIRSIHAELRDLAHSIADSALQRRLRSITDRLARLESGDPSAQPPAVALSPRETDVLSQIALGCTNSEAADRLSLRPETVKSYLRSAMSKLDAHSRHEAVVAARRLGVLP